jgi:outer membrane receptor for ferric coprogen and ferric-rhodotorulic acid
MATALLPVPVAWADNRVEGSVIEELVIIGVRDDRISKGATGLALDLKETPQSISIIDSEMMQAFGADDINDALELAPGLRVERWETNRTSYTSRGFEIKNTQIDGTGLPNNWGIITGAFDAYGYEKIEVIRGANGLLTGLGNASGTINFVRKRPTNQAEGQVRISAGSWDKYRLEADYSTPFSDSGEWAGRLVATTESSNSYLDGKEDDRHFLYGVIDGQLTENSTLAFGGSYQKAYTEGNMWGALSFINNDGSQAEWDTGANTSQDWTYWDTENQTAFLEYTYFTAQDWELKLSYNYRYNNESDQLFYAYAPAGLDPNNGLGLYGWPGKYSGDDSAHLYEISFSGGFDAFGETHELMLGVSYSDGELSLDYHPVDYAEPAFGALPSFPFAGNAIPEPTWGVKTANSRREEDLTRIYGTTRFHFGRLKVIAGFNAIDYKREALSLDVPMEENEVSPYVGVTYEVTDNTTAYVSYSDIYEPQDKYDFNEQYLEPTKGENYEAGIKTDWLDGHLLSSVAVFKAKQLGIGTYAGINGNGRYWYTGADVFSEGVEFEISGQLNDHTTASLGATFIDLDDENGDSTYTWIPEERISFTLNTSLPQFDTVSLGVSGSWQSKTAKADTNTGVDVEQGSYLLANAFARWDLDNQSYVQLNVNNLTDEKYINSLYEIGYYGAPRNFTVSYGYNF